MLLVLAAFLIVGCYPHNVGLDAKTISERSTKDSYEINGTYYDESGIEFHFEGGYLLVTTPRGRHFYTFEEFHYTVEQGRFLTVARGEPIKDSLEVGFLMVYELISPGTYLITVTQYSYGQEVHKFQQVIYADYLVLDGMS